MLPAAGAAGLNQGLEPFKLNCCYHDLHSNFHTCSQVFESEVLCYQLVLQAVHSSLKLVVSAIKGFDPVRGEFQDLIKQV